MDDHAFEMNLADYLAGEMPPAERRAFERSLAADPARHQKVSDLTHARDLLTGVTTVASGATTLPVRNEHAAMWRPWAMAAAVAIAFIGGFVCRGWTATVPVRVAGDAAVARAVQSAPTDSPLGLTLIALAAIDEQKR
jgi:anti-sigma factor RsiW